MDIIYRYVFHYLAVRLFYRKQKALVVLYLPFIILLDYYRQSRGLI